MTSYEGLRKLTLGDKPVIIKFKCAGTNLRVPISQVPTYNELCFIVQRLFRSEVSADLDNLVLRYEDEDGDLITIQDDADISHAISLSSLLKLTVNDKITHPVLVPIENLGSKLSGLNEKQTVAAVTVALIDLHDKIGKALQVIQAHHPTTTNTTHYPSDNSSTLGGGQTKAIGAQSTGLDGPRTVDSKPLVLTAESLDQLLEPRKSLLTRQASVSSQTSSLQVARSPPLRAQGTPQPTLSNVASYLPQQQQQSQQQLAASQPWTPQGAPLPNGVAQSIPGSDPTQQQQQQQIQQHQPAQLQQQYQPYIPQTQPQPQQQQPQQQQQQQQQPYPQYGPGNVSQQQQQQQQRQTIAQQPLVQNQLQGQQQVLGQQQSQVAPYGQQQPQ
ncbi:hypothetical protein BGX23_001335, partial [Mortierella sp. AD031]